MAKMKNKVTAEHPAYQNISLLENVSFNIAKHQVFAVYLASKTIEVSPESASASKLLWFTSR